MPVGLFRTVFSYYFHFLWFFFFLMLPFKNGFKVTTQEWVNQKYHMTLALKAGFPAMLLLLKCKPVTLSLTRLAGSPPLWQEVGPGLLAEDDETAKQYSELRLLLEEVLMLHKAS